MAREDFPRLVNDCHKCGGTGATLHGAFHGPEEPCGLCDGLGKILTPEGAEVAKVVQVVRQREKQQEDMS